MELIDEKPVGAMGRIVIPDKVREECHMEEGSNVAIYITEDKDVLLISRDKPPEELPIATEVIKCTSCREFKQGIPLGDGLAVCASCARLFCSSLLTNRKKRHDPRMRSPKNSAATPRSILQEAGRLRER